jgi:hypothetical protein
MVRGSTNCSLLVGEIVAALDGELVPFPYDPQEGVHTCEILLGKITPPSLIRAKRCFVVSV